MLRAIKNTVKSQDRETAEDNYNKLAAMFNFSPVLDSLIKQGS